MNKQGSFSSFILHLHPKFVPSESVSIRFTWCMGGLAFWMFLIEVFTGLILIIQYVPTLSGAYGSIIDISQVIPFGFFIRNLHYWCGQFMVIFVLLHTVRVILTGSYAAPRHWNWLIGIALLIATLLVDFTGYLLIWDDRSFWAWTIAANLAAAVPLIGQTIAQLLFFSTDPSDSVLIRIYIWHVFLFPLLMTLLLAWHFWRIRKDGISRPL